MSAETRHRSSPIGLLVVVAAAVLDDYDCVGGFVVAEEGGMSPIPRS